MKIYNKFVESKKEPYNKNDIWFDGKVFKVYKEGEWQAITLELEAADKIYEVIKDISNVYQEKLTAGDGISIKNNTISLETFYQVVDSLPKTGKTNTIYLVTSKDAELNNKLVEYIWINNTWEKLGEHKTEIKIPTPDWNAVEGEAGHIENKICRFMQYGREYKFTDTLRRVDFTPIPNEYGEVYLYKKEVSYTGLQLVVTNMRVTDSGDTYSSALHTARYVNGKYIVPFYGADEAKIWAEEDPDTYQGYLYVETMYSDSFPEDNTIFVVSHDEDYIEAETLPEAFIPNTVLKTTPQRLSDVDKNQVKANLDLVDVARQKDVDKLNEETTALWKDLKEGYHPNSTVGFSDDLVGRGESVPAEFSFRASGGKSIKDGTARIKRLKGNSVVWNNMVDTRHLQGEWSYQNDFMHLQNGHIYAFIREIADAGIYCIPVIDGLEKYDYQMQSGVYGIVFTSRYNTTPSTTVIYNEKESGACNLIDLTLMFSAGNEPTTIEEYNARKPIVADEYAYNEGEVIHMTAEGIKSVGDNVWDEEWENGLVSESNGEVYDSENHFCPKNKIRIIPNTQYYFKKPKGIAVYLMFYDADNKYIGWLDPFATTGEGDVFTTLNATYMRFTCYTNKYNNDITISLYHSGWKAENAKYQPYWEDRLMLDARIREAFPNGMSKWDMVYNKNGKGYIVHGLGVVEDMSKMDWERNIDGRFQASIIGALLPPSTDMVGNIMCNRYTTNSVDDTYLGLIGISLDSYGYVWVRDDAYTDAASLKESFQGVPLFYQLAEPTIIEYDEPFNLDYKVADFGTEEIIAPQPSAPISADIIYQFNAVDMIREHELEITELQRIIATMQAQLASLTKN